MNPNQPQQPQGYPPQQPQNAPPQYSPHQAGSWQQPPVQQPVQQHQQMPPQIDPWAQPPQTSQQPIVYEEQPSLVPEGMASIDYLNQISTHKTSAGFTRKQVAIFGGLLLLAFGVLAAFMISNGGSTQNITTMSQTLTVRIGSLAEVTKESQKNIKNQSLGNVNSALAVQLAGAGSALATAFGEAGVSVESPSENIIAAESSEQLMVDLEDAYLNGIFDRVYARKISYELEKTMIGINDIHTRTNNPELQSQLEEIYSNLEPLQKQFAEYTDTTG